MPSELFKNLMADVHQNLGYNSPQASIEEQKWKGKTWKWEESRGKLNRMSEQWTPVRVEVEKNRKNRYVDFDVKAMRANKELLQDEILIPKRAIHNNIRRDYAPYMQFVREPRRSIILNCLTDTEVKPQVMERDYTRMSRYDGWEQVDFRVVDAASLHGWAAVETCFDTGYPGHFYWKMITPDNLEFDIDATDIQMCGYLAIRVKSSIFKLEELAAAGRMNKDQVAQMRDKYCIETGEDKSVEIKHLFYKGKDGIVFHAWYNLECLDWLADPKPLYQGKQKMASAFQDTPLGPLHSGVFGQTANTIWEPIYEREYPIDIHLFYDTEDEKIVDHRGHGFFDLPIQSGLTAIWSGFVNGLARSANVFGSPKGATPDGSGVPKPAKAVELLNGYMYDAAVEFWSFPTPSNVSIMAAQALSTENAQDNNQQDFAVLNRKDARKTSKEFDVAEQAQSNVNSVGLMLWAMFQRAKHKRGFAIVQARAKAGKLPEFLMLPKSVKNGDPENAKKEMEAREYLLTQRYEVRSSGETDVIERQEKIKAMLNMYDLIAPTPLGPKFLEEIIITMFPENAEEFRKIMQSVPPQNQALQALSTLIGGLLEKFKTQIPPEQAEQILQTLQQAQQLATTPQ
jgi:hypothetical protein